MIRFLCRENDCATKDMPRMGFEPVSLVPKTSTLSS